MTNQTTIGAAMLTVWALVCASCAGGGQNVTAPSNAESTTQANAGTAAKPTPTPDPCANTNVVQRRTDIQGFMITELDKPQYAKLKDQITATPPTLAYRVLVAPVTNADYLKIYVGGRMSSDHGNNGLLKKFEQMIDPVFHDRCVMEIQLVTMAGLPPAPSPTPSPAPAPTTELLPPPPGGDPGFVMNSCDYPANPCPNGTCSPDCQGSGLTRTPTPTPTPRPSGTP